MLSECIRAAVDFLSMSIDIINLIKSEHLQPILVYRRYLQLTYKWHLCPAPTQSPGEIRGRGGAGSHSWMDCLAAELFRNSCFSDIVLVTLFRTAVGTATSPPPPPPPNSVVLAVLTVSSVFTGRSAGTSYSYPPPPPPPRHL